MKLKNLFEVAKRAKEKNLIGQIISGTVIDENTRNEKWAGDFACSNIFLTSLEGSPREVSGSFNCGSNKLTSLEGGPTRVNGYFSCSFNRKMTTLDGAPEFVGSDFHCGSNELVSLRGAPRIIGGRFYCGDNELVSLKGAPRRVGGSFYCDDNELISLDGAPSEIGSYFNCNDNHLTSLHNIHKHIKKINGGFYAEKNPIKSHVLGLMLIDGITKVRLDNREVENILNDGIKNKKHWTEVQVELEEAGFEEYAQL